jgi:PAS domain S-box-containing protein
VDIIGRKRAEEALKESEERYRAVVEQSVEAIYLFDPDSKLILESNEAFQRLIGYSADELLGMTIYDFNAHQKDDVDKNVWRSLGEKGRFVGERTYRRKDGSSITVEISTSVIPYDGKTALCTVSRDITERKRAEARLREAEERYRTLVEQIPAATYVQEANGSNAVRYVSPQIEPMLGYKPEECISDPEHWIKVLHPADRERVLAEDERTNETGEPFRMEYRQFTKEGRVVWLQDEAVLVRDEEGKPLYWQGVQIDITERKRAEEALAKERNLLRTLIDNLPDYIFVKDAESRFVINNAEHLRVLGAAEQDQVAGKTDFDVFPRELAEQYYADELEVVRTGQRRGGDAARSSWCIPTTSRRRKPRSPRA